MLSAVKQLAQRSSLRSEAAYLLADEILRSAQDAMRCAQDAMRCGSASAQDDGQRGMERGPLVLDPGLSLDEARPKLKPGIQSSQLI